MKNLIFKTISDLHEAEAAWKALSPNIYLYDDWNYRYAYYKHFNYPLHFYAGYDGDELVGLLPLMLNEQTNKLDFFGGFSYMEDNRIFTKPGYEDTFPLFMQQIEGQPVHFNYMHPSMAMIPGAVEHVQSYFIKLEGLTSYQDFMNTYLSGDARRNMNSQVRKLAEQNVVIADGDAEDVNTLAQWNKERFGERSSFNKRPYWTEFFYDTAVEFESKIVVASIEGKKVGIGFLIYYKDMCYDINNGYDPDVKNLGKYLTLLKIDRAIKDGKKHYDAGGGAFGWKEDFHFDKRPLYELVK